MTLCDHRKGFSGSGQVAGRPCHPVRSRVRHLQLFCTPVAVRPWAKVALNGGFRPGVTECQAELHGRVKRKATGGLKKSNKNTSHHHHRRRTRSTRTQRAQVRSPHRALGALAGRLRRSPGRRLPPSWGQTRGPPGAPPSAAGISSTPGKNPRGEGPAGGNPLLRSILSACGAYRHVKTFPASDCTGGSDAKQRRTTSHHFVILFIRGLKALYALEGRPRRGQQNHPSSANTRLPEAALSRREVPQTPPPPPICRNGETRARTAERPAPAGWASAPAGTPAPGSGHRSGTAPGPCESSSGAGPGGRRFPAFPETTHLEALPCLGIPWGTRCFPEAHAERSAAEGTKPPPESRWRSPLNWAGVRPPAPPPRLSCLWHLGNGRPAEGRGMSWEGLSPGSPSPSRRSPKRIPQCWAPLRAGVTPNVKT